MDGFPNGRHLLTLETLYHMLRLCGLSTPAPRYFGPCVQQQERAVLELDDASRGGTSGQNDRNPPGGFYAVNVTSIQFVQVAVGIGTTKEYLDVGCRVATAKLWLLDDCTRIQTFRYAETDGALWPTLVFDTEGTGMACIGGWRANPAL